MVVVVVVVVVVVLVLVLVVVVVVVVVVAVAVAVAGAGAGAVAGVGVAAVVAAVVAVVVVLVVVVVVEVAVVVVVVVAVVRLRRQWDSTVHGKHEIRPQHFVVLSFGACHPGFQSLAATHAPNGVQAQGYFWDAGARSLEPEGFKPSAAWKDLVSELRVCITQGPGFLMFAPPIHVNCSCSPPFDFDA